MTTLRIVMDGKQVGQRMARSIRALAPIVRDASRQTARNAAEDIEDQGRADISSAGKFGSRWTDGFQAKVTEGGGFIKISVSMAVPYWTVFQNGKVIEGKPLLWIPLDFADDAKGVLARNYGALFRVDRIGKAPLLMAPGRPAQAKYFGKESVTIPKKFHLLEIIAKVARGMPAAYRRNFKFLRGQSGG